MPPAEVTVVRTGPMFTGEAQKAFERWMEMGTYMLARQVIAELRNGAHANFRNPTGYWESQIRESPHTRFESAVTSNTVYTNWLEGVSARNQTTRFKGYHLHQTAALRVRESAGQIVVDCLPAYLKAMNG
jgi:hypothetical protein